VSRRGRLALAAVIGGAVFTAGCGSAAAPARGQGGIAVAASPLDTSVVSAAGTWAAVVMGGSAADFNNFWQLFIRPAAGTRWRLVTPPGTADNGGLVLAAGAAPAQIAAFRPSQFLTYTPLSQTGNGGQAWSAISPLDARLASTPSALAIEPGTGRQLMALTADGTVEVADTGASAWHTLTTVRKLAASPAGRRCGLRDLTAAVWTPTGVPLLAGTCSRLGTAGIFADESGSWHAVGPTLPASLKASPVTVLRLTTVGQQVIALLGGRSGAAVSLTAAWSPDAGAHWSESPALRQDRVEPLSVSFGPDSAVAVITSSGNGAVIAGPAGSWQLLPALPSGTATLALGAGQQVTALAVKAGRLTVWQLAPGGSSWTRTQVISVAIPYGSSG
jgi:hypothetical protein